MSKCNNCRIEILDETEYCPLCHSVLEKTEEMENTYPDIRMKSKLILFLSNIYLFLAIATESILIGYSIYRGDGFLEAIITGAVLFLSLVFLYHLATIMSFLATIVTTNATCRQSR